MSRLGHFIFVGYSQHYMFDTTIMLNHGVTECKPCLAVSVVFQVRIYEVRGPKHATVLPLLRDSYSTFGAHDAVVHHSVTRQLKQLTFYFLLFFFK